MIMQLYEQFANKRYKNVTISKKYFKKVKIAEKDDVFREYTSSSFERAIGFLGHVGITEAVGKVRKDPIEDNIQPSHRREYHC